MTAILERGAPHARRFADATVWRRALLAWVILAVAMTLNGIFRVTVLVPQWGEVWAGVASAASGIALIQLIARQAMLPPSVRQQAGIALVWLVLTVAFEFIFGHYADGKPWPELLANYNLLAGHLWPVVLASLVAAPFLWGRHHE